MSMTNVRIVTDVSACLEPEFVAENGIVVLPVEIRFGDEQFLIGPGESATRLFERMTEGPAKKAQASIPAKYFRQAYEELCRSTEEIVVILSSSKLNQAYSNAEAATRPYLGRCRITIVDSLSASWGLGLIVKTAAQAAQKGYSLDDIVRLVRGMLPHIYSVFFVDRLDFLERGGRIDVAQALLGTMLHIKPLLLFEEGDILPLEKVRTLSAALEKLSSFVAEFASLQQVVILQSPLDIGNNALVGELRGYLNLALPNWEFPVLEYGPVLACHLGPEALGIVAYESD